MRIVWPFQGKVGRGGRGTTGSGLLLLNRNPYFDFALISRRITSIFARQRACAIDVNVDAIRRQQPKNRVNSDFTRSDHGQY
jgi:hypothetical protein